MLVFDFMASVSKREETAPLLSTVYDKEPGGAFKGQSKGHKGTKRGTLQDNTLGFRSSVRLSFFSLLIILIWVFTDIGVQDFVFHSSFLSFLSRSVLQPKEPFS